MLGPRATVKGTRIKSVLRCRRLLMESAGARSTGMELLELPSTVIANILKHLTSNSRRALRLASRGLRVCVDTHVEKLQIQLPEGSRPADAEWIVRRLAGSALRPATLDLEAHGGERSFAAAAAGQAEFRLRVCLLASQDSSHHHQQQQQQQGRHVQFGAMPF